MTRKDEYPCLCGGTFFVLLLQAKKSRTQVVPDYLTSQTDGLSQTDMLRELIQIYHPSFREPAGRSFKSDTSQYKSCTKANGEYLPFNNQLYVNAFNERVKNEYSEVINEFINFVERFIDVEEHGIWLVQSLIELIEQDKTISEEAVFYIGPDKTVISKAKIRTTSSFVFEPFLLSVWHYIVLHVRNNKIGRSTYERWHKEPESSGKQWYFCSDIGLNFNHQIQIKRAIYLIPEDKFISEVVDDNHIGTFEMAVNIYLSKTKDKYMKMKTLLYTDPRPFYDFYVCNDIKPAYGHNISNINSDSMFDTSDHVILTGTGGLGKSMMMRHLLLDAIKRYPKSGFLPIFISLKDYDDSFGVLSNYIFSNVDVFGSGITNEHLIRLLSAGMVLILFDGMDEMNSKHDVLFERELEYFIDRYPNNRYVISSRPYKSFINLSRFSIRELQPLSKKQAVALTRKLDFRPDEPIIKVKFLDALNTRLFETHKAFCENPLLLTIMLMTFDQFADIPSKMHLFYDEVFVVLSQKHDATKGAYTRALKTGLTVDIFKEYFAELCARSYYDEKVELTKEEFIGYYEHLSARSRNYDKITKPEDFLYDLCYAVCLMFFESGKYHFIHRSFQEYFSALFFSKQKDKYLEDIGDAFENREKQFGDSTFRMLYEMIPAKVEEYIFVPYLKELFNRCETKKGYWTFLSIMYPTLFYSIGEIIPSYNEPNVPSSFIFSFISSTYIGIEIDLDDLPFYEEFVTRKYVHPIIPTEYPQPEIFYEEEEKLDPRYGKREPVGWQLEIDIEEVLNGKYGSDELLEILESNDCCLKYEYDEARALLQKLEKKQTPKGKTLFDFLE